MNINSAAALIHGSDLATRHLRAVAAAVQESPAPEHTEGLFSRLGPLSGLGAKRGSHAASRRSGDGGRISGPPRRAGVVFRPACHGPQGDQLLPSPCRPACTHRYRRGQDDPGRGQEPRRRTRKGRAEAGPRAPRSGVGSHYRHCTHTEGVPFRPNRVSPGRALARSGGHRHRVRHERRTAATRRSRQPALGRREVPAGRELPGHHPALEDVQHARCPLRGRARDGDPEVHPPEEAGPESQGVRSSARQDHQRPDRRGVQGGGTRRRVLGTFPKGGNDPGPDSTRGRPRCDHERRTAEVRTHARALLYGAKRRGLGPLPVTTPGRAETTEI